MFLRRVPENVAANSNLSLMFRSSFLKSNKTYFSLISARRDLSGVNAFMPTLIYASQWKTGQTLPSTRTIRTGILAEFADFTGSCVRWVAGWFHRSFTADTSRPKLFNSDWLNEGKLKKDAFAMIEQIDFRIERQNSYTLSKTGSFPSWYRPPPGQLKRTPTEKFSLTIFTL